nr:hypothetical protein [Kibdelosporangium sp. MJ126-NF4]CEL16456.1 hypothetical protein [Kibdelosporangium sp. MJ126-NF4]CTQ90408.1 hypothetical protein [Kibdelosporangium sp. MJ126-NF4]
MSLSVVYVKEFNHVVGALSLTGASPPTSVAALVGDELPLRLALDSGRSAALPLSESQLGVAAAADEPGVFTDALAFGVELDDTKKPKPVLVRLKAWQDALTLTAAGLAIKVPAPVGEVTKVLALISDGQDIHTLVGEIPAGTQDTTLPVAVGSGEHALLVLVAGFAGRLETAKLP